MSVEQQELSDEIVSEPEIEAIEEPMRKLLVELKPNLLNDSYGTIIGDDTSGTFPAVIVNTIANKLNYDLGRDAVLFLFLQSSRLEANRQKIASQLDSKGSLLQRRNTNKKALIVTEHIGTGYSVSSFRRLLDQRDIESDIATISARYDRETYDFSRSLFVGQDESFVGTSLSLKEYLTGKTREKFAKERFNGVRRGVIYDESTRERPHRAYQTSRRLAERLYTEIFGSVMLEEGSTLSPYPRVE
jgi:hypothetical protein